MTNLTDIDPLSPLMTEARLAFVVYLVGLDHDDALPRRLTDWTFEEIEETVHAECEWEEDGHGRYTHLIFADGVWQAAERS